jgi:hypothetical protein
LVIFKKSIFQFQNLNLPKKLVVQIRAEFMTCLTLCYIPKLGCKYIIFF